MSRKGMKWGGFGKNLVNNMVIKKDWLTELKEKNAKLKEAISGNMNPLPKTIGCSEIFTLDSKGNILKKEWKCEEIKNWAK